jgi:NAD(P)-dependent dehydrogenase (short-subunit alcohol dehydrogenase family)
MKSVVISGASTGIGFASACALDAAGWSVYAGVRTPGDEANLRAVLSPNSRPVRLDVTDNAQIAALKALVESETDGRLDALVNNAGIVFMGPFEALGEEALRRLYDVNVFGVFRMTRAFAPLLRAARGRIVNVGSVSGRMTLPFNGLYASSKFAVRALSDSMNIELGVSGVKTILIEPGCIRTEIWNKPTPPELIELEHLDPATAARSRKGFELVGASMQRIGRTAPLPAIVVRSMLHALNASRPRSRYVVGSDARLQLALRVVPSGLRAALFSGAMRSVLFARRT